MKHTEIWEFVCAHKVASRKIWREFVQLKKEDFEVIKPYLKKTIHPLNLYKANYRSTHLWRHFHATENEGVFEIHWDFANPSRHLWLTGIPHLLCESIPYLLFKIWAIFFNPSQLYKS